MKKLLTNLLILLFTLSLSSVLSVLTMIHGYGVQPVSYKWIIFAGIFGQLIAHACLQLIDDKK